MHILSTEILKLIDEISQNISPLTDVETLLIRSMLSLDTEATENLDHEFDLEELFFLIALVNESKRYPELISELTELNLQLKQKKLKWDEASDRYTELETQTATANPFKQAISEIALTRILQEQSVLAAQAPILTKEIHNLEEKIEKINIELAKYRVARERLVTQHQDQRSTPLKPELRDQILKGLLGIDAEQQVENPNTSQTIADHLAEAREFQRQTAHSQEGLTTVYPESSDPIPDAEPSVPENSFLSREIAIDARRFSSWNELLQGPDEVIIDKNHLSVMRITAALTSLKKFHENFEIAMRERFPNSLGQASGKVSIFNQIYLATTFTTQELREVFVDNRSVNTLAHTLFFLYRSFFDDDNHPYFPPEEFVPLARAIITDQPIIDNLGLSDIDSVDNPRNLLEWWSTFREEVAKVADAPLSGESDEVDEQDSNDEVPESPSTVIQENWVPRPVIPEIPEKFPNKNREPRAYEYAMECAIAYARQQVLEACQTRNMSLPDKGANGATIDKIFQHGWVKRQGTYASLFKKRDLSWFSLNEVLLIPILMELFRPKGSLQSSEKSFLTDIQRKLERTP